MVSVILPVEISTTEIVLLPLLAANSVFTIPGDGDCANFVKSGHFAANFVRCAIDYRYFVAQEVSDIQAFAVMAEGYALSGGANPVMIVWAMPDRVSMWVTELLA